MRVARVVAQCKVNLFLHVLAREASGYHQLETLFCRLTLGDVVTVRLGGRARSLDCAGPQMPPEGLGATEQNLAWRAAEAFAEAAGVRDGWAIEIEKQVPVGGGLGGGSADAGAVLRLLNSLVSAPLPERTLQRVGAALGADVPFLTQSFSTLALAWGRGERMLALPPLPSRPCVLVSFPFGVSTADAYRWLTESPAATASPVAYSLAALGDWAGVEALLRNEFERVVLPHHPAIADVLTSLRAGGGTDGASEGASNSHGDPALMSGSGATVFVLPSRSDPAGAEGALQRTAARCGSRWGVTLLPTETAVAVEQVETLD